MQRAGYFGNRAFHHIPQFTGSGAKHRHDLTWPSIAGDLLDARTERQNFLVLGFNCHVVLRPCTPTAAIS